MKPFKVPERLRHLGNGLGSLSVESHCLLNLESCNSVNTCAYWLFGGFVF